MNLFSAAVSNIRLLLNIPTIPPPLATRTGPLLVHISDTPHAIYPYIYRLIEALKPEYLVHTGDIVDNAKIGIRKAEQAEYHTHIKGFLHTLESLPAEKIFLVPGNHDNISAIETYIYRSTILPEATTILCEGVRVETAHYIEHIREQGDFFLYGHNGTYMKSPLYLNGYSNINCILLHSKTVVTIPYPYGTHEHRGIRPLFPRGV